MGHLVLKAYQWWTYEVPKQVQVMTYSAIFTLMLWIFILGPIYLERK